MTTARRQLLAAWVWGWLAAMPPTVVAQAPDALARQTGLDVSVVQAALSIGTNAHRLIGADDNGMERLADGLTVEVPRGRAAAQAEALRRRLGPGYVVFISQRRHGIDNQPDDVSVIRSSDPFDALRVMNTSGIHYALSARRVIAKLHDWDRRYGLQIVGAGHDWLEARLKRMPPDMRSFAIEVFEFCPDVVSEISSVDRLGAEIGITRTVYLWWD